MREPEMTIESKDLGILRETASKALLAVLWLHVPICMTIGMVRGSDWLLPAAFMVARWRSPRHCRGVSLETGFRPV
jgi:hypothetical protein